MKVVLFCGGAGMRLRGYADDVPKPMVSVLGRPFLEWIIRYLADQGIERVILSTGFRADTIEHHFQSTLNRSRGA